MSEAKKWQTPPELAKQLGVEPAKVIGWITRGELRAVDFAKNKNGKRPRWRIAPEAFETFCAVRESQPKVRQKLRQKRYADFEIIIPPSSAA